METPQEFYEAFNASCTGITTSFASLSQNSSNRKNEPESREARLAQIARSLQAERKKLNDATFYLPPHDRQSYDTQLSTLESKLNVLRNPVSKNKFAFKKKATNVNPNAGRPDSDSTTASNRNRTPNSPPTPSPGSMNPNPSNDPSASKPSVDSSPTKDPSLHLAPSYTGENLKLITLSSLRHSFPTSSSSLSTPTSLTISSYNGCIIYLLPPSFPDDDETDNNDKEERKLGVETESLNLTAVYLQNIQNSIIILGHVNGAVLAHNLERCAVVVSCHQLRIHTSHHASFHLSVRANAIIEDSTALTFGAYPTSLPAPSTQHPPPLRIHDFTHPSLSPSSTRPANWTLLPLSTSSSVSQIISQIASLVAGRTDEGIIIGGGGRNGNGNGNGTDTQSASSDEIQLVQQQQLLNALENKFLVDT